MSRRWRLAEVLGAALLLLLGAAAIATWRVSPWARDRVVETLAARLDSEVTLELARSDAGIAADAHEASARERGRVAVFDVINAGLGVDATELPRFFERFFCGARARQHAPDGSGLGLSIAQSIVQRNGGWTDIGPGAAGPDGPGCRARVHLPLADGTGPGQDEANGDPHPALPHA